MIPGPWMQKPDNTAGYCKKDCPGAPQNYYWGGETKPAPHVHHECWNCGEEVISGGRSSYSCRKCGCEETTFTPFPSPEDFDPDIAAERPSPALLTCGVTLVR